jgi:CRP-like cAMP-binding protein
MAAPNLDQIRNRLLLALPQDELEWLRPSLEPFDMFRGRLLLRPNRLIDFVYFPQSGMVSLVLKVEDGNFIEVGLIGNEGMVGALAPLGATAMSAEARVQMPGSALRLSASVLRAETTRNPRLMELLLRYVQALFAQVSQSVACNSRHQLSARMARWLLMAHDCVEGNELELSHEFLATMLGVRRAGITVAVGQFKKAGLIDTRRGRFVILNRRGLEGAACSCYRAVKAQYRRLLPDVVRSRKPPGTARARPRPTRR